MIAVRTAGWQPYLAAAAAVSVVAFVGGLSTEAGPWYRALEKPFFQPPPWVFGPAWALILSLTAFAIADAWSNASSQNDRQRLVMAGIVNGALNISWSILFFKFQRPDLALIEVLGLWISIVALLLTIRRTSHLGARLVVPYLLWVSLAVVLNAAVVWLNSPF